MSSFQIWQEQLLNQEAPLPRMEEMGQVTQLADGIAYVSGLDRALADELVVFASGVKGVVLDLEPNKLGIILLGSSEHISLGEAVYRTKNVVSLPVGSALLGRVINPLGEPLDEKGSINTQLTRPLEQDAPSVLERAPVNRPLATGITAIDAAIPIGLGQRQLIIGDRQTGKTSIALDTLINQKSTEVICIYCSIGQRGDSVARAIQAITRADILGRSVIMHAGDEEAPGLSYLAPYAAMTLAEYFCAQGKDVLVIYDDLTHHAQSYRELSLLLKRPPGREAYPGDIFYLHARLLERAGQFTAAKNYGSITALPIVETQAENLSAYIPTNLISITDGQVYLAPKLVQKSQFPAVDLGLSVSRVGGKAQNLALRSLSSNLRVALAQFEELEDFARFGTRLDEQTQERLVRGASIRKAIRQAERQPLSLIEQLIILHSAMEGLLDNLENAHGAIAELRRVANQLKALEPKFLAGEKPTSDDLAQILNLATASLDKWKTLNS